MVDSGTSSLIVVPILAKKELKPFAISFLFATSIFPIKNASSYLLINRSGRPRGRKFHLTRSLVAFEGLVRRKSHFKWNFCTDFFCRLI